MHYDISPRAYQTLLAVFRIVIAEYCALHFGLAAVAPVDNKVVVAGVVADIVSCPLPVCKIVI